MKKGMPAIAPPLLMVLVKAAVRTVAPMNEPNVSAYARPL
jgi:hypothetical protein